MESKACSFRSPSSDRIRSDEGLTLETSASESLHGGQFTLLPQLIKPDRSDEGLAFETSASESLYGGQFTLSVQLIKPNYLVIFPTDAAP